MTSRITRLAAATLLSGALMAAAPLTAGAGTDTEADADAQQRGSGWTPYEQPDIDYAAGFRCEFAMHGEVLKDHEEFKDVAFWPDGTVRTQLWRGALVIRWSNVETGESVVRDQSAKAVAEYGSDGGLDKMTSMGGAFSAGLPEGGSPEKGVFIVDGKWSSIVIEDDGNRAITLGPRGSLENLCDTLG